MGYQQNSHLWRSQKFWSDCGFLKMQIVLVLFALTKFVLSDNAGQGVDTETLEKYVAENKAELAENKAELAQLRMEIAELRNDVIGCQAGTAYHSSSIGSKWKYASYTFEREFKSKPSLMVAVTSVWGSHTYAPGFHLEANKVDLKGFSVRYWIGIESSERSIMYSSYMACGRM